MKKLSKPALKFLIDITWSNEKAIP